MVRSLHGAVLTVHTNSDQKVPFVVEVPSGVRLGSYSSLHHVITPLLEQVTGTRVGDSDQTVGTDNTRHQGGPLPLDARDEAAIQGRIWEALSRVSTGLARNPSLSAPELLLYLHATLTPYVAALVRSSERKKKARGMLQKVTGQQDEQDEEEEEEDEDDDVWGDTLPSYLREESSDEEEAALYSKKKKRKKSKSGHQKGNDVKATQLCFSYTR